MYSMVYDQGSIEPIYSPKFRDAFKRFLRWAVSTYGWANVPTATENFPRLLRMFEEWENSSAKYKGYRATRHYNQVAALKFEAEPKRLRERLEEILAHPLTLGDLGRWMKQKEKSLPEGRGERPIPGPSKPPNYIIVKVPPHYKYVWTYVPGRPGRPPELVQKRRRIKGYSYITRSRKRGA
jgi:quinol monooxygenase YgiN